jgi:hypothetical protein
VNWQSEAKRKLETENAELRGRAAALKETVEYQERQWAAVVVHAIGPDRAAKLAPVAPAVQAQPVNGEVS